MEGAAEGGTVRRRPEFVSSASQEFNLIARVLARSLVRFMDDATAEDWIAVAAGHASRPVTLNEGRNAAKTAKRVFGVIFDRCEKDPYAVIDLIARDREVLEEAQRGQGRKLQHQLRPEPLDASELELDQESKSEPTNVLPSFTLAYSFCLGGSSTDVSSWSARYVEGMVLGEDQVGVILRICMALHHHVIKQEASTQLAQPASVLRAPCRSMNSGCSYMYGIQLEVAVCVDCSYM